MRISKERCWLAVLALAAGIANGDVVTWTQGFEGSYNNPPEAIIANEHARIRGFKWQTNETITEINVWRRRNARDGSGSDSLLASWESAQTNIAASAKHDDQATQTQPWSSDSSGHGIAKPPFQRRQEPILEVDLTKALSSVIFTASGVSKVGPGLPLYFQLNWTSGASYSRLFTLSTQNPNSPFDSTEIPNIESFRGEGGGSDGPTSPNLQEDDKEGSTGGDSKKDGSKGGLSSGAVIGIAVACGVIGLAIIFALVWWFVRRRKQQKELLPMNSAFSSGRRTEDLMVQKEANAETDAGPHSPYSDEGAAGTTHGSEALAAGAASSTHQPHAQDQSRSFTPYSDRPSATGPAVNTPSVRAASLAHTTEEASRTGGVPSPTPGRATPRALSTPYAHLVEEGMTEDEIRRLEDEERQLDAAIEQAGRRPSAV